MDLASISPFQLVIMGTVLSLVISGNRDAGELNVLGNLIVAVGSLVLTVAAQKEFQKTRIEEIKANNDKIQQLIDKSSSAK